MGFYEKFIQGGRKGYSLRGGPFTRWRSPLNSALYRKRLIAGPEPERPRSSWLNWNYDCEISAFSKRLNEEFKQPILKQAFVHPSFIQSQKSSLQEIGLEISESAMNNLELRTEGESITTNYLKALLRFWYTKIPNQGIEALVSYLTSTEQLSHIAKNIGIKDLVKSAEFPISDETLAQSLYAVIAALNRSSGLRKVHLFINDFIVTQLIGKELDEIWVINNPMGLLVEELKKSGKTASPTPRLIWSTGVNNPTAVYMVGIYVDKQFFSKGSGETIDIAEEMAARDGLRRIYELNDIKLHKSLD